MRELNTIQKREKLNMVYAVDEKGNGIPDEELLEYIEESRNMSKSVEEYGAQKGTAITCAKRMADILGEHLLKEKNLCSKFIISKKPLEAPIAERAIPTIIFKSQRNIPKRDRNIKLNFSNY